MVTSCLLVAMAVLAWKHLQHLWIYTQANNYDETVNKLSSITKEISRETMIDTAIEIHELPSIKNDEIINTLLTCNGSWHRRGCSSSKGVVTTISLQID